MILHSPFLMPVGVRYFAFSLGVACVPNMCFSDEKGTLKVSLKTGETACSLSKRNFKIFVTLQSHPYRVVRHRSVGQQGAVKTVKIVSEG